ncbi:MAG TPA: hypothetical protein VLH40_08720 [Atribacteraceae bacterium]|nr:hypothetical protein [Atribacteraceae bacterium]
MVVQAGEREFWVVEDICFYQKPDGTVWLRFDGREMCLVPRQLDELGLETSRFHWDSFRRAYRMENNEGISVKL